jgi:predicted amidohydrolase YtcJ
MKFTFLAILFCINLCAFGQDLILYNGKIFTSDKSALWADAIAIKGPRIIAVGKKDEVMKNKTKDTRLIDLEGRLVVPGFNDAHAHISGEYPSREIKLFNDPVDQTPWEVVRDSLQKIVKEVPIGTLIHAVINPALYEDQRARAPALDSIAPLHPVMLTAWTGHGKILNTMALKLINLNPDAFFSGGYVEKSDMGKMTGYLEEYAGFVTSKMLNGKLATSKIIDDIKSFHLYTASFGITTMQNMCGAFSPAQVQLVYAHPDFSCRTRLIAFPQPDKEQLELQEWSPVFRVINNLTYGSGVKLILDGTPIERLACMREPYFDKSTYGKLNFSKDEVKKFLQYALSKNQQPIIHAVGDSTITTIIIAMRELHPDDFWKTKRLRIEHAEMAVVKQSDIALLKKLGIVIVQNPTHLALPTVITKRFSPQRMQYLQVMNSLIKNGIPLAIGSDGPVNPFLNLMLSTIHPNNPKEAISLEDAVIAYTYGSAYAESTENEKGTLSKGKLADLAVLSQNIFEIPTSQLPATTSVFTLLDGKVIHDDKVIGVN